MQLRHIAMLVGLAVLWGFNFVPIRVGLEHIPAMTFVALRFLVTFFPAVFFLPRPKLSFKKIAAYGLLTFAGQFSLLFTAIHMGLAGGLASLVLQVQAFFTIGFAAFFMREKPRLFQVLGALVAFGGIGIVATHTGGDATPLSLLLAICAAASWAGGNILTKSFGKIDIFAVMVWGNMVAFIPLTILALLIDGPTLVASSLMDIHWQAILSLAYIAYVSTFIGYTLWGYMLGRYPAALVAPFTLLVPIFAMISTHIFFGENFALWKLMAGLLIISGLCLNQFGNQLWLLVSGKRIKERRKNIIPPAPEV
jgi:O-acetylserine/cysteine efflux transporter